MASRFLATADIEMNTPSLVTEGEIDRYRIALPMLGIVTIVSFLRSYVPPDRVRAALDRLVPDVAGTYRVQLVVVDSVFTVGLHVLGL